MSDAESVELETLVIPNRLSVFARPDWAPGRRALSELSRMLSGAMTRAIADRILHVRQLSEWGRSRSVMARVFGFDLPHHLLRAVPVNWVRLTEPQATKAFRLFPQRRRPNGAEQADTGLTPSSACPAQQFVKQNDQSLPVNWVRLTEPQATKAFAYFLNADDRMVRSKRIQAFLRVLGSGRGGPNTDPARPVRRRRHPLPNKSVSICCLSGQTLRVSVAGAVVEAKFGHRIVSGTLPKYREHLQKIERQYRRTKPAPLDEPLLFVISSRLRDHDKKALRRNKGWRWMSWRSLLLAEEWGYTSTGLAPICNGCVELDRLSAAARRAVVKIIEVVTHWLLFVRISAAEPFVIWRAHVLI